MAFLSPFRCLRSTVSFVVALLSLIAAPVGALAQASTTITGTVYAPNQTDPLPNIYVFIQPANQPVVDFSQYVGVTTQCPELTPAGISVSATTDYMGNFTLSGAGLNALVTAANNQPFTINLIIQAGKWRQQNTETITPGMNNPVGNLYMPANHTQKGADLPKIAVVTGSADGIECIFPLVGISSSEVTDVSGSGQINFFPGTTSPGVAAPNSSGEVEADLMNSYSTLQNYDMLMFGCQGTNKDATMGTYPTTSTTQAQTNLAAYANNGGRVFATHYAYIWLNKPATFQDAADWHSDSTTSGTPAGSTIILDTTDPVTFPEGPALANWLQYIGASPAGYGVLSGVENVRQDFYSINSPPSQSWGTLTTATGPVMQFTFNTPISSSTVPTVGMAFANNPTNFSVGDTGDTVTITVANTSAVATGGGLTLTLVPGPGFSLTPTGLAGQNANTSWQCNLSTLQCISNAGLAAMASDPIVLTLSVPFGATLGNTSITGTIGGGNLQNLAQCGRVLFNDYHVFNGPATGQGWPKECNSFGASAVEKFLEYSLYNLSNFIAPTTTDTINVQSPSTTTITNLSDVYYGQVLGTGLVVGTSATAGANNGSFNIYLNNVLVCTLQNTTSPGTCPTAPFTGLNAGTYSIYAVYTGDAYYGGSTSPTYTVHVLADPTTTTLSASTLSTTPNQPITLTAMVSDTYTAITGGSVNFFDGATLLGNVAFANGATATVSLVTSTLTPGSHTISACLVTNANYQDTPCSNLLTIIIAIPVTPAPTTTVLVSGNNPSVFGQAVTFTAAVATTGAFISIPAGAITFYDGTTALNTTALDATGTATFTTSSLAVGTHAMTAVYAGNATAVTSTSNVLSQVVDTSATSAGTGFVLNVTPTTFSVGAGTLAILSVSVIELNNFNQTISLSCTGQPSETACLFGSQQIPVTGGTTTLTVYPSAAHPCNSSAPIFTAGNSRFLLTWIAAAVLALGLARRRKRLFRGLALVALLGLLPALNGCGSGNCTDFGVKPGTYTFQVVATSAGSAVPVVNVPSNPPVTHSQPITMTVTIN